MHGSSLLFIVVHFAFLYYKVIDSWTVVNFSELNVSLLKTLLLIGAETILTSIYTRKDLQYLVYEIFWIHLLSAWRHSGSLFIIVEHSCSDDRVGTFSACVYMSSCWHDRSDRCYFCIFKNQFVVYNFFYFFCANQVFKLLCL